MPSHDLNHVIAHGGVPRQSWTQPFDQPFDGAGLHSLRAAVAAYAASFGVPQQIAGDVVAVVNELATNAVRHGGGAGRLLLWHTAATVFCRVVDTGQGIAEPETVGTRKASARASGGRGLWIVRQLCDDLDIASGPTGTTVTAAVRLDGVSD